jgi:branched-subunit amino acid aminotransferase/4-amino-4-deoxychorismate lyase
MRIASAVHGLLDGAAPVFRADDEALLRGAAAFETLRVYAGRPFLLAEHIARLQASIAALALDPVGEGEVRALLDGLLDGGDGVLRLYRTSHDLVATLAELPSGLEEERAHGLTLRTFDLGAPALLAGVKATSYADAFAARRAAEQAGADDVLFLAGGVVLEATTANIWWRAGGRLCTPALAAGLLPGVTRGFVLGLEDVDEVIADVAELAAADEAFLTSSIREVMPVVALDGAPIGDGRPGPAAVRLQAALRLRSLS